MPTTFTNQATLAYNGALLASNIVTGELIEDLTFSKTPVSDNYTKGDNVTYVLTIANNGTAAYNNLTVTDNLGEYTVGANPVYPLDYVDGSVSYYINGTLQTAPTVTAGPPMVISGITVPAGGNATVIYQGTVNAFAPLNAGATITNTASVSGAGIDQPIQATATVNAANGAELTINKSVSPNPISENSPVTFTFVIQNTGNTAADTGIVVSDQFNPILSDITAAVDGTTLTPTTQYTYNPANGQFTTVGDVITVPAATYQQDQTTGVITTTPGVATLTITGTI